MSRFRSQHKRGPAVSLVRQFGETIVYYSRGLGSGRTIQATIQRGVEVVTESNQTAKAMIVAVVDDPVIGISSTEIDDGRDKVCIALDQGGVTEIREITLVQDDSNGMVRFIVR